MGFGIPNDPSSVLNDFNPICSNFLRLELVNLSKLSRIRINLVNSFLSIPSLTILYALPFKSVIFFPRIWYFNFFYFDCFAFIQLCFYKFRKIHHIPPFYILIDFRCQSDSVITIYNPTPNIRINRFPYSLLLAFSANSITRTVSIKPILYATSSGEATNNP